MKTVLNDIKLEFLKSCKHSNALCQIGKLEVLCVGGPLWGALKRLPQACFT